MCAYEALVLGSTVTDSDAAINSTAGAGTHLMTQ